MDQISEDLKKKYHISTKTDLEKTSIFNRIRNTISRFFIRTKSLTSEDRESISQKITDIRENDDKIFEYDFNENIVSALENEINNMEIADNDFLRYPGSLMEFKSIGHVSLILSISGPLRPHSGKNHVRNPS